VDAIAGLCGGLIFVHCLIFLKAIHIKLQLVLIAYTAQNWSPRLLFPSAWNNFTAIRSTVVMLNSNTYRSSFRAAQAGYIQLDRGPKHHAVSRQVTSRRTNLLKDSRQLVVQEPFRVRFRKALPSNTRWASPCIAARPLRIFPIFEPIHIELRLSVIRGEFGHLLQNPSKTVLLKVRGESMRTPACYRTIALWFHRPGFHSRHAQSLRTADPGTLLPARIKEASDMRVHVIVIQTKE
jgi:hypothetical protein